MAKQTINIGTSPNKGDGDPLRTAFTKINNNFDELYAKDATDVDLSAISESIIPDTDVAYDLGSASKRFRDLYLSGSTIDLGGTTLSVVGGALQVGGAPVVSQSDLSGYVTQAQLAAGSITVNATGDLQGSVFADDSTLLVDAVNGVIPYSVLSGAPSFGNWTFSSNVLSESSTGNAVIQSSDFAGSKLIIRTRGVSDKDWAFNQDGGLTFPDTTVQTTAWTGSVPGFTYSEVGGTSEIGVTADVFDFGDGKTIDMQNSSILFTGSTISGIGDLTLSGDIRSENAINIDINLSDSTLRRWTFGEDGNTEFPGNITAQGFIGTAEENLRVESGKISLNSSKSDSLYTDDGGYYTSASWSGNNIDFTAVDDIYLETLLERFSDHFDGSGSPWDEGYSNITVRINDTQTLTVTNASFSGGTNWRVEVAETPASDPTAITTAEFFYDFVSTLELDRDNNSYAIALDDSNFRINTRRDIRLESGDDIYIDGRSNMRLRNYSRTSGITIETDFNNEAYEWLFGEDGTFQIPGDTAVAGHITGTSSASTLVLGAEPNSNTYIQLNDTVDSTINTVANLEIHTDVDNAIKTWIFGTDGSLEIPGDIKSEKEINIRVNLTDSTTYTWRFGEDGDLTLPNGKSVSYTPANPSQWLTPPTTIKEAIDRLADYIYQSNGNIPI